MAYEHYLDYDYTYDESPDDILEQARGSWTTYLRGDEELDEDDLPARGPQDPDQPDDYPAMEDEMITELPDNLGGRESL